MPRQEFINHHSLDLLKAALPYMHPRIQKSVEVLSMADEFINMIQTPEPSSDLSTMSISSSPPDMEEILQQLKSVSNKQEQDMIDSMSGIIKMQKMMQNYRSFMTANPVSALGAGSSSQDTMMQFLMSQLSPEQRSNFENMSAILNAMNN